MEPKKIKQQRKLLRSDNQHSMAMLCLHTDNINISRHTMNANEIAESKQQTTIQYRG